LCLIFLWRVGCRKVIHHLLFDQETAINTVEHKKMSLESYSQEARRLLASFLSSLLDALGHWYAPMLPDDHPFSFVSLMVWLQVSLLCHSCPESLGFCCEAGQKQEFIQFPE
jgi:hypothetical protein